MDTTNSIHQIPVTLELTYDEFITICMALGAEKYLVRGTKAADEIEALEKKISAQHGKQFWNRDRSAES